MNIRPHQKALITGAASGIGLAIALELADHGVDLFLLDIDQARLQAAAGQTRQRGSQTIALACDLSNPDQVHDAIQAITQQWGQLDLLVNNAGLVYWGNTHDMTREQWDQVLGVNLLAPIQLIHSLLPLLRANGSGESHILNVCSATGLVPKRRIAAYQTTKFALVGLSLSMRAEYSPTGLGVTALCPGLVESTGLFDRAGREGWLCKTVRIPRWMGLSPQRVARRAIRAIQRNQGLVLVSLHARLFWWLYRLSPTFLDRHRHWQVRWKAFRHRRQARGGHA